MAWVEADWTRTDEDGFYLDLGCPDLGIPSCLSCPLSRCRYDRKPKQARMEVHTEAIRQLLARGLSSAECAAALGVSLRTVARLKARVNNSSPGAGGAR